MDVFYAYSIPVIGLKLGIHQYKYSLDQAFFSHFESSPVAVAGIECTLSFDKRVDMLVLDFELNGWVEGECDRCTAMIHLPVKSTKQLLVKYGDQVDDTEDEVVFISREASHFNVARYLYEFSVLALPITNTYDCENDPNPPCNREVLKYLSNDLGPDGSDPVWDILKDLNKN